MKEKAISEKQFGALLDKKLARGKEKPAGLTRDQAKKARRIRWALRLVRYLPWIRIPESTAAIAAIQVRDTGQTMFDCLRMFRGSGSFYYRQRIHMSEKELNDELDRNTTTILNLNREHTLCWNWLLASGNMEGYIKFREAAMIEIERLRKAMAEEEERRLRSKFKGVVIYPSFTNPVGDKGLMKSL
jgi:hypothetical protein